MKTLKKTLPLDTLQILDVLQREGTFSLASAHLNRSVSALSYQIQKLEDELGVLILDRSGHRAAFTQVGQMLVDNGRQLLAGSDELVNQIQRFSSGWESELLVSYDGIIGQDIALSLIGEMESECSTRLYVQEDILSGGWEALISGRADILISSMPHIELPNTVNYKSIGNIEMVWVAAQNAKILNEPNPLSESTRREHTIIAVADTAKSVPKTTKNILLNQKTSTVSSMSSKLTAIQRNLGIGTLPKHLVKEELETGCLVEIGHARTVDIVLAWQVGNMGKAKTLALKKIEKLWRSGNAKAQALNE
ncbi:LysR family transcriptional regulator [Vibrio gigantis]|uniref:LysR family transcriptional regulator n=1 Tax=Vibrio gigantis TaxID=296199 RepID=UPI001EFB4687|nr:LysR family transcriptional regulator [Vibrio gigantis]ULN66411.1 LysR family transcriptional regulator [Vibrio gigantis]